MKKGVLGASLIVLFGFTLQALATTTVFKTIKKSGGDFSSLKEALDAIPNDLVSEDQSWIIEFQDGGIYKVSNLKLTKTTDANHTIIIRSQSLNAIPTLDVIDGFGLTIDHTSFVTIDGLKIMSNSLCGVSAIRATTSDYVTIRNCEILSLPLGIYGLEADFLNISDNKVYGCQKGIILSSNCDYNAIERNKIYHNTLAGLALESTASQNAIRNNILFNNFYSFYIDQLVGEANAFTDNVVEASSMSKVLFFSNGDLPSNLTSNFNTLYSSEFKLAVINKTPYITLADWTKTGLDQDSLDSPPHLADNNQELVINTVIKTVKKSGGDFNSIQDAINAAPKNLIEARENWIIQIEDSAIYNENIAISEIYSTPSHKLVLQAKEGEIPILKGKHWDNVIELRRAQYVSLEGLTIDATTLARGIFLYASKFCTIKGCHIYGAIGMGITGYESSGNVIFKNKIHDCQRCIELFKDSSYNSVHDNEIYRSTKGCGIYLSQDASQNEIKNNILFYHNSAIVLYFDVGKNNIITHNIISHTLKRVAIWIPRTIPEGTVFDHNNIYLPEGHIAQMNSNYYTTLTEWQKTGMDQNSTSQDPNFVSTVEGQEDFKQNVIAKDLQPATEESLVDPKPNGNEKQEKESSDTPSERLTTKEAVLQNVLNRKNHKK